MDPRLHSTFLGPGRRSSDIAERLLCGQKADELSHQPLVLMLPNGSTNSTGNGRTNLAAFLALGGVCPTGYGPGLRKYSTTLSGRLGFQVLLGRPQNMPMLAATGHIDAFIAFDDVVSEAAAAGISGVKRLVHLPFAEVKVVTVVKEEAPFGAVDELLASVPEPVTCASELPFLAGKAFWEEEAYRKRFGTRRPVIQQHGRRIAGGCSGVTILESAGTSEALVAAGIYDCATVVASSGRTIRACALKMVKVVGTYHPWLYCRPGLTENPLLRVRLEWFSEQLKVAIAKWQERQRYRFWQLELPFATAHDNGTLT